MTTYNTDLQLPIGHLPKEDYFDELVDVHNALELLAQRLYKHIVTVDEDYDITVDDYTVLLDTTDNPVTAALLDSADVISGKRYEIKTISAANLGYVAVAGGDTVDGSGATITLTFPESITVVCDDTGWWIV